jgi:Fur family zinc uptake transcriptional regulator
LSQRQRLFSHAPPDVDAVVRKAKSEFGIPAHRFTSLRLKVLQAYLNAKRPLSAYGLPEILNLKPQSAMMGIYRALEFLEEINAIHRVEVLGSYVVCRQWGRAHTPIMLLCASCDAVEEIASRAVLEMFDHDLQAVGFQRRQATIELSGLCAACQSD